MTDWNGLYPSIPSDEYHTRELGVVSKSVLDLLWRSPAHYKAWADGAAEEKETEALAFGSAFHCALLEPERFASKYVVQPEFGDCRKTDNKKAKAAWLAEYAAATSMSDNDADCIARMVRAVQEHPLASRMVRDGQPELTARWTDATTGLRCKSRADYYLRQHGMIADVKTSIDGRLDHFRKDVAKYNYHWQDAMYRSAFSTLGEPVRHFVFIVVEKTPPHAIAVYALDPSSVAKGHTAIRMQIDKMAECMSKNEWPGYPAGIQEIDAPSWAA